MAAIVQSDSANGLHGSPGGRVDLAAPPTPGNLLVICMGSRDGEADQGTVKYTSPTTSAGFTLGPDGEGPTGNVSDQAWWYKISDGTEQSVFVDSPSTGWTYYAEVSGAALLDGHSDQAGSISAGGGTWTGGTAVMSASGIVFASIVSETSDVHIASQAWAAGWTEVLDKSAGADPFFGPAYSVAYRIVSAGSYTPSGVETIDGGGSHAFNAMAIGFIDAEPEDDDETLTPTCCGTPKIITDVDIRLRGPAGDGSVTVLAERTGEVLGSHSWTSSEAVAGVAERINLSQDRKSVV